MFSNLFGKGQQIFVEINKKKQKQTTHQASSSSLINQLSESNSTATLYESDYDPDTDGENEIIEVASSNSIASGDNNNKNILLSSIILALNACYHVCLQKEETRKEYREEMSKHLRTHWVHVTADYIKKEIDICYEVFLDEIQLPDAIARNQALKENIFMMLICVELKIPLFIIGKPGSSKSLAKTLISLKMQGSDRLASPVLANFKEAQLITFQCSPMSTSEMILKTFRYCAKYQLERENDLDRYTSVVVLDEIGLAEASASMPLKALHPLLEDGVHFDKEDEMKIVADKQKRIKTRKTQGSTSAAATGAIGVAQVDSGSVSSSSGEDWHRVGFIGISNWVLDPAKMNRGLFF